MNEVLYTTIIDTERTGWSLVCPACNENVSYTALNIASGREPFLYCDRCSNFTLRREDAERAQSIDLSAGDAEERLREFYDDMERRLPPCPCGGHFRLWSNVKCPHCRYEFPYNGGVRSESVRFWDPKIIWIEKAVAFRGASEPSNRLACVNVVDNE